MARVCPNNGDTDIYRVTVKAGRTIMVEDINEAIRAAKDVAYQEDLTKFLTLKLNADVSLEGWHQGVHCESSCKKSVLTTNYDEVAELKGQLAELRKDKERLDWLLDEDTNLSIEFFHKENGKTVLEYLESREDIDKMMSLR